MKSKIQEELAKASKCAPDANEKITGQDYMAALVKAVGRVDDETWDGLSDPAQDWFNEATDAFNKKKQIPSFPDLEQEEEAPAPRSRRRASADDEPKAAAYEPKKGDDVTITTKKGKQYKGKVVDPNDAGELVIDTGEEDLGIRIDNIDVVAPVNAEPPADEPRSRRRNAAEEEPEVPAEPGVGDTVEIKTKRGTVKMGNVIEIDELIVAIKDAAGEEVEFDRDRIESIVVKVKKSAEGGRRRASADAGSDKVKDDGEKSGRASGGVGLVVREMIIDHLDWSKDKVIAEVKKQFPDAKDNTVGLNYTEVHKIIGLLKDRKMIK